MQTPQPSPSERPLTFSRYAGYMVAAICLGIAINCFYNLSHGMLMDWDEARHGVSAWEMLQSGDFLVNTYGGVPDYWNTKPPMSFWSVALGYTLFGDNPFGLRFFSALSICAALFLTLLFCARRFGLTTAVCTGLVLMPMQHFFLLHNARTGDPDGLFLLFHITGLLAVLAWPKRYPAYYAASFLAGLAFLTKSFHAGPLVLLLMFFFFMDFPLSRRSVGRALLCLLIGLAPVALWAVLRFQYDGLEFFNQMIFYDLLRRSQEAIEGHVGGLFYYVRRIGSGRAFGVWFIFALIVSILWLPAWQKTASELVRTLSGGMLLKLCAAALLPVILFSLAASKLYWYGYSAYPFLALLLGIFLERSRVRASRLKSKLPAWGIVVCAIAISLVLEINVLKRIHRASRDRNPVHTAMIDLGRATPPRGATLFRAEGAWTQSDVLASRLYGPFNLADGGRAAYDAAKDKGNCFLIPTR